MLRKKNLFIKNTYDGANVPSITTCAAAVKTTDCGKTVLLLMLVFILAGFVLLPVRAYSFQQPKVIFQHHYDTVPGCCLGQISTPKKFVHSSILFSLSEVTPWATDMYLRHMDYANISLSTLEHNISLRSWSWDGDGFTTNQFGHPYHGSYFFNSFRANGYNFWQSAAASFAGSYIWETAAENQAPAPNDFINTGFGGMIPGEMTHRLANKIINNHSRGLKRQLSEITAFAFYPVNGFSRIINGQWGRYGPNNTERDSSSINAEFDLGIRRIGYRTKRSSTGLYGHIKLVYGTPFENNKTPFSHIYIDAEFGKDDSSKLNILSVYGSLRGWEINAGKSSQLLLLTANYDYIRNSAFFYSAQSLKANLYSSL